MKQTWKKFDKIDYLNKFSPNIKPTHKLLEYALLKYKIKGVILDIGGGPGITAGILRGHKNNSLVYNIEPSKHCFDVKYKNYKPLNMSLKQAIKKKKLPQKIDCLVACSSLHELALSNNRTSEENKRIMFEQIHEAIKRLKKDGLFIICEIEYKKKATNKQIKKHIWIAEHTIGHDHPREELLTILELKNGLKKLKLIETCRKLQTHTYKNNISKLIWSKLAVFKKI